MNFSLLNGSPLNGVMGPLTGPDILPQQDVVQSLPIVQTLSGSIAHGLPGSINQIVPIFQTVSGIIVPDPLRFVVQSVITVSMTTTAVKVKPIDSVGMVGQTVSRQVERVKSISQNLPINQSLVGWIDNDVSGNDGSIFVDPAIVAFEAGLVAPIEITLSCVNVDALPDPINTSINLRKPEFGDTDALKQFRVERTSLGGSLEIFKDRIWPTTRQIKLSFVYLSEEEATGFLSFLSLTLGQKITLIDQFGRTLVGFIDSPFDGILQPKVNGWSASFDFQIYEEPNEVD